MRMQGEIPKQVSQRIGPADEEMQFGLDRRTMMKTTSSATSTTTQITTMVSVLERCAACDGPREAVRDDRTELAKSINAFSMQRAEVS